jgi:hypothetical protein
MRLALASLLALCLVSCAEGRATSTGTTSGKGGGNAGGSGSVGGMGGTGGMAVVTNADGDCLTDAEEAMLGTDPNSVDTDGDGQSDCDEIACKSSPTDPNQRCYACGWKHNDPGNLVSTGPNEGDVIANLTLIDQCKEPVKLWDFAGEYHILFMTAAW